MERASPLVSHLQRALLPQAGLEVGPDSAVLRLIAPSQHQQ
jgi:hypothetical protein